MTRRVILCLSCLFICLSSYAIDAVSAYTVFYKKAAGGYGPVIELYWQANPSSIHFSKNTQGQFEAAIVTIISISNDTGIIKEEKFLFRTKPFNTIEEAYAQGITDKYEYPLPAGSYTANIILSQQDYLAEAYQYADNFDITPIPSSGPFLSGIQLIDTIIATRQQSLYTRNGQVEIPFPTNYLDDKHNTLKYYTEVYLADSYPSDKYPLRLNTYISWKKFGAVMPSYNKIDTIVSGSITPLHGSFSVDALPSGNFYLNTVLLDKDKRAIDKKSLLFQRFNPHPAETKTIVKEPDTAISPVNVFDLSHTFVGKYNPAQIRSILKMLSIISDPVEGEAINLFLKRPDELYSKYFIYNFWEKRNKQNPEKAWKEYAESIKEVNRMFSTNSLPGFESDRGRVYIKYGKPNDRIIVSGETGALPYEIWQYYATGKQNREAVFLFYKPGSQLGEYILLHSTLLGEIRNMSWRSLLYSNSIAGPGNINTNSQAEQYIGSK